MKTTNTTTKKLFLVLLAVGLLAAASAWAQGPRNSGRGICDNPPADRAEMRLERMTDRLDLTEEQAAAIAEIEDSYRAKDVDLHKELMRLRNERRGEMLKDNPSENTVIALTEQMGGLKTQLQVNHMKMRLEIRNQLTSEQRDKMLLMRGPRGGDGFGPGAAHPQGRRDQDGRGRRWKM